jgi:arylsulfatase A-like enzyme
MDRRQFLANVGYAVPPFVQTERRAARPPNVVMFMTDDHGVWATGAYGCADMHTPNIDRLSSTGVRFTNAFACTPVCSPKHLRVPICT